MLFYGSALPAFWSLLLLTFLLKHLTQERKKNTWEWSRCEMQGWDTVGADLYCKAPVRPERIERKEEVGTFKMDLIYKFGFEF